MNQQEAKKKITDLIRLKIKELTADNQVVFDLADLFIWSQDFNCDKEFMDGLCAEFESSGVFMNYCYHVSGIWRHLIIISKKPIENYLPHNGYQCGWAATEKDMEASRKEHKSFMQKFRELWNQNS